MAKIESLTPEQIAAQAEYVRKYTELGRRTENLDEWWSDANRDRLQAAFDAVYRAGGVTPVPVIRVESPHRAAALVAAIQAERPKLADVAAYEAWARTLPIKYSAVPSFGYGQHDAEWTAFNRYWREVCGLTEETEIGVPLMNLTELCGWWAPFDDCVIVSARPTALRLDAGGRLHGDGVPALEFGDGVRIYALHGVRFKEADRHWALDPVDSLDLNAALTLPNADQRAAVLQRLGPDRVANRLKANVVDDDYQITATGMHPYQLLDVEWPTGGVRRYLKMYNPSEADKIHYEAVPPTTPSVLAALFFRTYGRLPTDGETYTPPRVLT